VPHRNTGHDRNRTVRCGGVFAADAGAPNTLPDNGTAPYVFVAVAARYAVVRDAPAVPDVDGTAPRVVVAD